MTTTRRYESELRQAGAEATRRSILDGAIRVMARGPASVSIPAVAEEAGVSVPTVYRHFGDKQGLVDAIVPYVGEQLGFRPDPSLGSIEDIDRLVHELFRHYAEADPLIRAALTSGSGPIRAGSVELRMGMLADALAQLAPNMSADERLRLSRVLVILTCSEALRIWQDRFELAADEVADHVSWAVRTLIESTSA